MPEPHKLSILILYHFYKPDDVISARHFSDLAEGLAQRNWDVTVHTSNRFCRNSNETITPDTETINKVKVVRFHRPAFNQARNIPRMFNSIIISAKWLLKIVFSSSNDVILLGTDPQLGYFIAPFIRIFKPRTKIALWAFDLYPEIIHKVEHPTLITRILPAILYIWAKISYRSLDLIADLGCCMRERIKKYKPKARLVTLIPWAITEPGELHEPDAEIRRKLFGEAKLAILYSGTIGKAHSFTEFIELARILRQANVPAHICFAGRGNNLAQLQKMVTEQDTNISFAGFADERELELRLTAADIHLISLREGWQGLVVPSKFFGSLAVGRPLIYAGSPESAIKKWIEQYQIGYILSSSTSQSVADSLTELCNSRKSLVDLQNRTLRIWKDYFARDKIIDSFDSELRSIVKTKGS